MDAKRVRKTSGVRKEELDALSVKFEGEEADKMLSGLVLTNARKSSGNRLQMFSASHIEQAVTLENPESPLIATGYEYSFGKYTDSKYVADKNLSVVAILSKYPAQSTRGKYTYVVIDENGEYDVIEVSHYEDLSEEHGYVRPPTEGDLYSPGQMIPAGQTIFRSNNHDKFGNYRYGKNINVAYIGIPEVVEDGIAISRSLADNTVYHTVEKTEIILNSNDVLLNLYGDRNNYKCFPDIGEDIDSGIVCGKRKIEYANAASELTTRSLSEIQLNDSLFRGEGFIADIDIYINKSEELQHKDFNRNQLASYFGLTVDYHRRVVHVLGEIIKKKFRHSARLQQMYERSIDYLQVSEPESKMKYDSPNGGAFEFAYIVITRIKRNVLGYGSKLTDRFGGKAVVCKIMPDDMMPIDEHGVRADLIVAPSGVPARANIGQSYEHELNFISSAVARRMSAMDDPRKKMSLLIEYLKDVNEKYGNQFEEYANTIPYPLLGEYMAVIQNEGITIHQGPFSDDITYEQLKFLYKKYKVKPGKVRFKREFNQAYYQRIQDVIKDDKGDDHMIYETYEVTDGVTDEVKSIYSIFDDLDSLDPEGHTFPAESLELDESGGYRPVSMNVANQSDKILVPKKNFADITNVSSGLNGKVIREFTTQRPVIIAKKYMMLLKHTPDSKFSARSIGSINSLGLPAKAGHMDKELPYSTTPIKFGDMELTNSLTRVSPGIVNRLRATYSTHIELRTELAKMLLTEDPMDLHDLPIKDEEIIDTIPAKLFQVYMYTLGFEVYDSEIEERTSK